MSDPLKFPTKLIAPVPDKMSDVDLIETPACEIARKFCHGGEAAADAIRIAIRKAVASQIAHERFRLHLCASCIEPVSADWTYCPGCGAQGRLNQAGEKI